MSQSEEDTQAMRVPRALGVQSLLIQCAAFLLSSGLSFFSPDSISVSLFLNIPIFIWVSSGLAVFFSYWMRQPVWWWGIHAFFLPAAFYLKTLAVPSWVFLMCFVVCYLVFGQLHRTRVPLFLSRSDVVDQLVALFPENSPVRCVDLGCGIGSVLFPLIQKRPHWHYAGYEIAWFPWLIARMRAGRLPAGTSLALCREDFWPHSLQEWDIVYVFLSPAVMPQLWEKARREMKPGSFLVSNQFEILGVQPDATIALSGGSLYVWSLHHVNR